MNDVYLPVLILAVINALATALVLWRARRDLAGRDREIARLRLQLVHLNPLAAHGQYIPAPLDKGAAEAGYIVWTN